MSRKGLAVRALRRPAVIASALALTILAAVPLISITPGNASPRIGSSKPTIVLVHGAWADASSWDQIISILQREGYTVDAPPNPLRGLTTDAAYLASYLNTISGPIVLVGHSYGGAVITNAATGNPSLKALVYVDAFAPAQGETLEQLTFAQPGSCLAGGGNLSNVFKFAGDPSQPAGDFDLYLKIPPGTNYAGFESCFATYVPPNQAAILGAIQRPLALGAFTTASGPPAWATIPSWAVIGREDQAIPPSELTFMAQRAHAAITYVTAGHLSMITQPARVADVITDAANAAT
jgi:pimeloyl-ACP methyl ester carboxylesterase